MRALGGNPSDLTVVSSQYDILLCSEILISDLRHVSELLVPGFGLPVLSYGGKMPLARGLIAYVRSDLCPCGMGVRIQPTLALRRVLRGRLFKGYELSFTTGSLHAGSSCMQWGV